MITVINHAGSYKPEQRGTYPNDELENLCLWIAGGGFNERQTRQAMLIANTVRESGTWSDKQLTINRTTDEA
jgi:hypothetical protein